MSLVITNSRITPILQNIIYTINNDICYKKVIKYKIIINQFGKRCLMIDFDSVSVYGLFLFLFNRAIKNIITLERCFKLEVTPNAM